jgi:valyl-tRNA synthetase
MDSDEKPAIEAKAWDKAFEELIFEKWKREKTYRFDKNAKGELYSIDTPPPYVNAPVHMGHAVTYAQMDMFARYRRMKGHNVLFPLGLDNNGLPIEMAAEKKTGKRLHQLPRTEALTLCRELLEKAGLESLRTFLRTGISFNSWEKGTAIGDIYETDSKDYRTLTQETFIDMWERGLIYEDNRPTNWDPGTRTTLADAEVLYEDIPSTFNDITFKIKETGDEITIGTTRPELVCTCGMVIFNPEDDRYKKYAGKTAITPVFNREVPIKANPAADMTKGTGIVMMCSFGDLADVRFFREQGLKPVIAINADGTMNEHAGVLKGLKVKEARLKMIELLREQGLLVGQKQITHRTPISERSKAPIEFIAMSELYVKQLDFREEMRKIAKEPKFYNERSRQTLLDWIDAISIDWPVSRRRFYATEVPLWYCAKCKHAITSKRGTYVQPWKDPAPVKECPKCKNTTFEGDTRVLDTWFDSSITPLYILKWHRDEEFFKKAFPCTLRPQGKDIIRTWLFYTLLKCWQLTDKCVFKDVWVNYHILDAKGEKMSKSKNNAIDPAKIIDKFGAEPFRLWAAMEGDITTTDYRCNEDRIKGHSGTLTKLWNVVRFASMFPQAKRPGKLCPLDNWIRAELADIVRYTDEQYLLYNFHDPAMRIRHFLWETFASHYLEIVKARAYNRDSAFTKEEQDSALSTIHETLDVLLKLMAPITPFITYKLYEELRKKDIHFEQFPTPEKTSKPDFASAELESFNSTVWKAKKDAGLSLRAPVKVLTIPKSLESIKKELQIMHAAETIKTGEAAVSLASA